MAQDRSVAAPRTVVVVAFDGFQLLDLAGPTDVFRAATLLGARRGYRLVVASPTGAAVRAENGIGVAVDTSTTALAVDDGPVDTLLVVGGLGVRVAAAEPALRADLVALAGRARRVTSVCTGAFALAAAGLLDRYEATTHWASCADLAAAHPLVDVLADRIYVRDANRWTSAGVTAGIDLALALVEQDHGTELAHEVAGWLVVFARRPGGQAQFSAQLRAQPARSNALAELQRWLPDHLTDDLSVSALARRTSMSERSFARAFRRETGETPAAFVEALRVEAARRLLETSDLTVEAVARAVGHRHAETLHRAFQRRLGTTPDRYRQHFAHRAS
jgi:transcriptional regulator GlxA family with amidase domain